MKKIDKILACVDLSEYSIPTLEQAIALARGRDTQILVLNVLNQRDLFAVEAASRYYPIQKDMHKFIDEMLDERRNILAKLIRDHFAEDKGKMTLKVINGIPFETILHTAETENIDLIVIANRGRSNLSRVLFGSVAEKVLRHSKITVVSVRENFIREPD